MAAGKPEEESAGSHLWQRRVSSAVLVGALTVSMVPTGGLACTAEAATHASGEKASAATDAAAENPLTQKPSSSPRDESDSAAARSKKAYAFTAEALSVPYGASLGDWANRDDVLLLVDENGKPTSASALAKLFADDASPLAFHGDRYPDPGVDFSSDLAWSVLSDDAQDTVALPDLTGLNISIAPVDVNLDNDVPTDALPLAPQTAVSALSVTSDGGEAPSRITGDAAKGNLQLWLGADELSGTSKLHLKLSSPSSKLVLSPTHDLQATGAFSSPDAGSEIVVPADARCLYLKLDEDVKVVDPDTLAESQLFAGQIARIPVSRDALQPEISDLAAANPDGSPIDLNAAWIENGTLTVTSSGLRISCRIADQAPTPGEAVSNIDESSLTLTAERPDGTAAEIPCASFENDIATFNLDLTGLGAEGIYRLDAMEVNVRDHAGNDATLPLSASPAFAGAGVTSVEVVDERATANKPEAELVISGATRGDDDVFYAEAGENPSISFRVTDKRFTELTGKADWLSRNPIRYTVNDETTVNLDPLSFSSLSGSHLHQSAPADALKLADEGRYEIEYRYTGAKKYILGFIPAGAFESLDSATVVIDRTAPQVTGVSFTDAVDPRKEIAKPAGSVEGGYVLIGGKRSISINVADAAGADAPAGAVAVGIKTVTVEVGKRDALEGGTTETSTRTFSAADTADGVIEISLDEDGVYRTSEIIVSVEDKAGNKTRATLADVAAHAAGAAEEWTFDTIVVDAASKPSSGIEVSKGTAVTTKGETPVHNASVSARYWISDEPWASLYLATDDVREGMTAVHSPAVSGGGDCTIDPAGFAFNDKTGRWEQQAQLPTAQDAGVIDGRYDLTFDYRDADASDKSDNAASFIVDTTAPRLTAAELKDGFDANHDVASVGGSSVLVGGERTIRVRVQDLVLAALDQTDERDAAEASGVGDASADETMPAGNARITVQRSYVSSFSEEEPVTELPALACKVNDDGWTEFSLDHEGVYDLDDIAFDVRDNAGNKARVTLAEYVSSLPSEQQAQWPAQRILVDLPDGAQDKRSVKITVADAPETPASEDPSGFFHRGAVVAEIAVADPWFEAYQSLASRQVGLFSATCITDDGTIIGAADMPKLKASAFTYDEADGSWKARYQLPIDPDDAPAALPIQGRYELSVVYAGISGATEATKASVSFGIDWTAPEFGRIELSTIDPVQWGWIFPRDREVIAADVKDNLSGVNDDAIALDRGGVLTPIDSYESSHATTILDGDGERIVFGESRLRAKDIAGNERVTDPLSVYANSNVPEGAIGASVDAANPVISVAYDNDDVRNGRYYNAARTATVTIVEANFDLVRENDPKRVIATAANGNAKTEYTAEQFERVDVEDAPAGSAWRLAVPFEEDGDWTFDVSFTDPAGREANPYHETFTIDTAAPTLIVTFDSNRSENGMYFNAARTATATVRERNFDPALATLAPASSTGNAPGAGPWTSDGHDGWTSTVHLGQEGRFALTASCVDLAGNAAEVIEIPEFVIDMTAPQITIEGVENHAAYAGRVAPSISYSDENFDPLFATYELTGAAQGDVFMLDVAEETGSASKRITWPDFEHTVERDDVYTLKAIVHDLAGNETTREVTFSVNRFGSNYILDGACSTIPGSYLAAPRDVVVHEINVSGLDPQASHAEIVHDSRVRTLDVGDDYASEQAAGANGWSDTTYTFPASLFSDDGYYRVRLTSEDRAGNLSQNTMEGKNASRDATADIAFAIDATAPEAAISGVKANGVYLDPRKAVGIDVRDNLKVASASLAVDGHEIASWEGADLAGYREVPLTADGEPHDITLTTVDMAGNASVQTLSNVVVADDWVAYVRNTPTLLYGLVAGVIAAIAAAGLAATAVIRRRRKKAALRNPFEK